MSFGGWFPRPGRRRAELRAALESVDELSTQVSLLRDEVDELRLENELLAHSVLIDAETGLAPTDASRTGSPCYSPEAGFRHATAKEVFAELETLVSDNAVVGTNQLVWPH